MSRDAQNSIIHLGEFEGERLGLAGLCRDADAAPDWLALLIVLLLCLNCAILLMACGLPKLPA